MTKFWCFAEWIHCQRVMILQGCFDNTFSFEVFCRAFFIKKLVGSKGDALSRFPKRAEFSPCSLVEIYCFICVK